MQQLKMSMDPETERFARVGMAQVIADERRHHLELDARFPGVLKDAIRKLRANGHHPKPVLVPAARRTMSRAARKRISLAQKARWAKQRKTG